MPRPPPKARRFSVLLIREARAMRRLARRVIKLTAVIVQESTRETVQEEQHSQVCLCHHISFNFLVSRLPIPCIPSLQFASASEERVDGSQHRKRTSIPSPSKKTFPWIKLSGLVLLTGANGYNSVVLASPPLVERNAKCQIDVSGYLVK